MTTRLQETHAQPRPICPNPTCARPMWSRGLEWRGMGANRHASRVWSCPACGRMRTIRLSGVETTEALLRREKP